MRSYEDSLKYYRDLKNSMDTARDEGKEEGIEIGIEIGREEGIEIGIEMAVKTVALALLQEGISEEMILKTTGLTADQLDQLRREGTSELG